MSGKNAPPAGAQISLRCATVLRGVGGGQGMIRFLENDARG
ncbi:hypothetical protein CFter6_4473 [Collimonas fungivorans]|uniref:Uncharacterized protein n=1 Tax=Collimonas fungivorans TaxID=158899 RepID=A0A127PH68_9BURK|nr:hypothetical protein CFter6_4473 [Collimonas fungivorans]